MTVRAALELGLLVSSSALLVMAITIAVIRALRTLLERRRARLEAKVRPLVLAAMDDPSATLALGRRHRRVALATASALLPNLRGSDRDHLAAILADAGLVAQAFQGLRSHGAVRRERSAQLLGLVADEGAVAPLTELLADPDPGVRTAAVCALGRIGSETSVESLFAALAARQTSTNTTAMALLRIGAAGSPGITRAMDDQDPTVRSVAAELAGSLGLTGAASPAELHLSDPDARVRVSAARALGRLGSESAVPTMIQVLHRSLDGPDTDLTVALVVALGQIGDRRAVPVLERAGRFPRPVSAPALAALAALGPPAGPAPPRRPARGAPIEQMA